MAYRLHLFPALTLLLISLAIQFQLSRWILRSPNWSSQGRRTIVAIADLLLAGLCSSGYLLGFNRVSRYVPLWWATWIEAVALFLSMAFIALFFGALVWRAGARFRPGRRAFFRAAGGGILAGPHVITALGVADRKRLGLN